MRDNPLPGSESIFPLVSICIPTYNRAAKLERAVKSLLICDYPNIEILISDNASSDQTAIVCERLKALDNRVRYYRHRNNEGLTHNFSYARSMGRGKYFLWHGDDDYLDSNYISTCVSVLEGDEDFALVSGIAAFHRGDSKITHYGNVIQLQSDRPWLRAFKYTCLVRDNSIFCGVYRSDYVTECAFPWIFPNDWSWIIEVVLTGKAKVIPNTLVYREFGETASSSKKGYDHLIRVFGFPTWYAKFPWVAKAHDVGIYLLKTSKIVDRYKPFEKVIFSATVAIILLVRGVHNFLFGSFTRMVQSIPFARKIYKLYFR
jgi:glycosyltransferase involved in cell wall biosynthesis